MTAGYGFGYISDVYPNPFRYVSDCIFDREKKRERPFEHSVALNARAQT